MASIHGVLITRSVFFVFFLIPESWSQNLEILRFLDPVSLRQFWAHVQTILVCSRASEITFRISLFWTKITNVDFWGFKVITKSGFFLVFFSGHRTRFWFFFGFFLKSQNFGENLFWFFFGFFLVFKKIGENVFWFFFCFFFGF